jgi:hypothetical protein
MSNEFVCKACTGKEAKRKRKEGKRKYENLKRERRNLQ